MMKREKVNFDIGFEAEIWWDADAEVYVAYCPAVDVYSAAPSSPDEATAAISEAVRMHLDGLVSLNRKARHEHGRLGSSAGFQAASLGSSTKLQS